MLHLSTFSSEDPAVSSMSLSCSSTASVCALIVPGPLMISPSLSNGGQPVRYRVSPWRTTVLVGALYFSSRVASGSTRMISRFMFFSFRHEIRLGDLQVALSERPPLRGGAADRGPRCGSGGLRFSACNCREVDRRLHGVVDEICQQELRGQRDHLDDIGVRPSGLAHGFELLVGNLAGGFDQALCEHDSSLALRLGRLALA